MKPMSELDAESILDDRVFAEIFDQEDELHKARLILSLEDRSEELKVRTKFTKLLSAAKKIDKETKFKQRKESKGIGTSNYTDFSSCDHEPLLCGAWIADDNGVHARNYRSGELELACYHPIIPTGRLVNIQTGMEQLSIAFKRNHAWKTINVPKSTVATANKIVSLADKGISVTSENAKNLVKYLSDVENLNEKTIPVRRSTSKLGWHGEDFIPYDTGIIFSGEDAFLSVYEAIHKKGDYAAWLEHVKELRATGRKEIKFSLAASFASPLIGLVAGLPFVLDLWGSTEGGKSICMALAASVWANPWEKEYIKDFSSSPIGLEVLCDLLNHLPLLLDDSSKRGKKTQDDFESLVYDLCSGKGKLRSNKSLTIDRERTWTNCILTNGEHPLNANATQGGAINRIIELECGQKIFQDYNKTLEVLKNNYGFAGKEFIKLLQSLPKTEIHKMLNDYRRLLDGDDVMEKQAAALAFLLAADKLSTDAIFKDGAYISIAEAKEALTDRYSVSENERCYRYVMDKIVMNDSRFDSSSLTEKWGVVADGYAVFYPRALDELIASGKFSPEAFLSWAERDGLLLTERGRRTKVKRIAGKNCRCIFLKMDDQPSEDYTEFVPVDEFTQKELPFG